MKLALTTLLLIAVSSQAAVLLAPARLNAMKTTGGRPGGATAVGQFDSLSIGSVYRPSQRSAGDANSSTEINNHPSFVTTLISFTHFQGQGTRVETHLGVDGQVQNLVRNQGFDPVSRPFQQRFILHRDSNGANRLLQRVFRGVLAGTTNYVLTSQESRLDAAQLKSARRISTASVPWTDANTPWNVVATDLAPGNTLKVTLRTDHNNHAANPFLHSFHPDHDNKSADFKTRLAVGNESYEIRRDITVNFQSPGTDFESRTSGGNTLAGDFHELITITAKHGETKTYEVRGAVAFSRLSTDGNLVPLTSAP